MEAGTDFTYVLCMEYVGSEAYDILNTLINTSERPDGSPILSTAIINRLFTNLVMNLVLEVGEQSGKSPNDLCETAVERTIKELYFSKLYPHISKENLTYALLDSAIYLAAHLLRDPILNSKTIVLVQAVYIDRVLVIME